MAKLTEKEKQMYREMLENVMSKDFHGFLGYKIENGNDRFVLEIKSYKIHTITL